jgi:pilus assembly protein CpaB
MLLLAVALGGVSVYLARGWLETQTARTEVAESQPGIDLTTVVVAKRPLNFGDTVTSEYLIEVDWPARNFPEGAFRTIGEVLGDRTENRVVLRTVQINEPVMKNKITGFGGKATLATLLQSEMRAVTIRINDVNGVAGFVLPGDHVDVLLTRKETAKGANEDPFTDVLLQHVKVLGIDQKASDDEDKPIVARAATLEVSSEEAQKLALAQTVGSLSLALRSETNSDATVVRTIRVSDLKGSSAPVTPKVKKVAATAQPAQAARRVVRTSVPTNPFSNVTVVRGVDSSTSKVLKDKDKTTRTTSNGRSVPAAGKPAVTEKDTAPGGPKIIVPQG